MKRSKLLKYLKTNGCDILREGAKHSIWINTQNKLVTAVPRHVEIKDILAIKICKDLGIEKIK